MPEPDVLKFSYTYYSRIRIPTDVRCVYLYDWGCANTYILTYYCRTIDFCICLMVIESILFSFFSVFICCNGKGKMYYISGCWFLFFFFLGTLVQWTIWTGFFLFELWTWKCKCLKPKHQKSKTEQKKTIDLMIFSKTISIRLTFYGITIKSKFVTIDGRVKNNRQIIQ